MNKISKNEKGFSGVEIILVLLVVFLLGVAGWYVYKNQHKTTSANVTTTSSKKASTTKTIAITKTPNPYADWKTATLKYEKITYQYPSNWTVTDKSAAEPKSQNGCTYPGHDLVTLNSPTGTEVTFNAGQDCFGYDGDVSFGSVPINALGQSLFLAFESSNGPYTPTSPTTACLAQTANPNTEFDFKSKNIFFNGTGSGSDPINSFCYIPFNPSKQTVDSNGKSSAPTFTVATIESSADYTTAKLIFESMHY